MKEKKQKIIGWIFFAVYIIVLFKLTVFRQDFLEIGIFTNGKLNLVPFATYVKILRAQRYLYMIYQFVGNIVWFIPFGFLLPYLTDRSSTMKRMLLFGLLMSVLIEFSQFAFGTGVSEIDDLILNTFGTFVGFQLFRSYTRVKERRK